MGPLLRCASALVLSALLGAPARAHGGRGPHVHVMPAGSPGSDVAVDAGICSGTTRPAPPPVLEGPLFDLRRTPVASKERAIWTDAGYRLDDEGGRILRADGKPLPDGEYRRLEAPFDAAAEPIEALLWVGLMTQGMRLDEKTCFFIDPEDNRPMARLEMEAFRLVSAQAMQFDCLSKLRATLRGLPGDRPIPADVAARLQAAQEAGSKLPQKVLDALAANAPARELLADTDAAYAALTRFFDARRGAASLMRGALPYVPRLNEPAKPRALVGSVEERLSAALSKDLEARFSTHEAGREMLERFRDKDGVVRLPVVRVLKLSQRPDDPGYGLAAAVQDPSNGTVIINHWVVASIAVAAAPPERRAALAREFGDAAKLNARLLQDADLRRRVLQGVEIMIAHEYVHAWQNRRSKYDVEMMRGNLPGANPLEKEHEAYREEFRYFHSLLKAHPAEAILSPELSDYLAFIADYDGYRAQITQLYMATFYGSSDFGTVSMVQEDRRLLARRLQRESLGQRVRQGLKLVGFTYGDKAMREAAGEDARRAREFRDKELPRMQAESGGLIVSAYASAGRPDLALGYAVGGAAAPEQMRAPRADVERYFRGALARLAAPTDPLDDRVRAIMSAQDYVRLVGRAPPKELATAMRRDYPLMAEKWLAVADKASTPEARKEALDSAQGFADFIQDEALLARVRAAREDKR